MSPAEFGGQQQRVAERHQARLVVIPRLHRPRAQPPHQAHEAVLLADLGAPAVQVAAEGHSRRLGQEVAPEALALHELDQHGDALVVVHQSLLVAVEQGVGVHAGGVHAGDGLGDGLQVLPGGALVGAEVAVVLAGEGGAEVVLQQARGAHDQRALAGLLQDAAQPLEDVLREGALDEVPHDAGVVGAHAGFGLVLLVGPVDETVGCHEGVEHVGGQEVGGGDAQRLADLGGGLVPQDAVGQHHPGRLAADLAVADLALADLLEVFHREPFAGDVEVGELVADHGADEHHLDLLQAGVQLFAAGGRHAGDVLRLLEEHVLRRQLGVEGDQVGGLALLPEHFLDDALEVRVEQVVGEVEIGLGLAHPVEALLPDVVGLLHEGVVQPLAALRLDGLLAHLGLEGFGRDDAALEQLPPHARPDAVAQDGVLPQGEVDIEDVVGGWHGFGLIKTWA